MASNITLSAGVRQNLLSLQSTAALSALTQNRLATGKKVNSALDNPLNFFTSQSLQDRAGDLNTLLDSIGQATQTLAAANQGLTSLTTLVQSAKSIATQALQTTKGTVNYTNITGTAALAADTTKASATASLATAGTASVQATFTLNAAGIAQLANGDTVQVTLNGHSETFTFDNTAPVAANGEFSTAAELIAAVNHANGFGGASANEALAASDGAAGVTITSLDVTHDFTHVVTAAGAFTAANALDVAHTLGDALTVSDGTNTHTFYRVAANANVTNKTYSAAATLKTAVDATNLVASSGPVVTTVNGTGLDFARADAGVLTFSGATAVAAGYAGVAAGTSYTANFNTTLAGLTGDFTVQVGSSAAHTITFGTGNGQISSRSALNTALAAFNDVTGSVNSGGFVNLAPTSSDVITIGGKAANLTALGLSSGGTTPTATVVTPNTTRSSLQNDFNNLLTQINQLAADASYNGINLLSGDSLKVVFNGDGTSSLTITGVKFDSLGLGLASITGAGFQDNKVINDTLTTIGVSLTSLRTQSSKFGSNLTTVQTRQEFTKNVITTLQTGADNLVLADTNEEGANLLALQTRQQLSTTALSLANQASQAVLRLFG